MSLRQIFEGKIIGDLTKIISNVAEDAKANARWSSSIPDSISVTVVSKSSDGKYSGSIVIDTSVAPEALAFEHGSGIHGDEGQTYPIYPRNVEALAFYWDKTPPGPGNKFIRTLPDGRKMFNYVDHPGVAPRPFIQPAIEKNNKDIKFILSRTFISAYREFVPRITVVRL